MVLYFNHCHASNMYPTSNRHPSHQSFGLTSYGYPGQQSSQYGPPSNMGDMGCAMAQYQMSGLGNISDGIQQTGQGMSMPAAWHSPAVYTMSSCSRGTMFDEWTTGHSQGQPPLSSSPCGHGPFSVSTASHHSATSSPSCNFGGYKLNGPTNLSGAVTPTPLGSSPGVIHHHGLHGSSGVSVNNGNSDASVSNANNGASGANNGHGTGSSGVNSASGNSDQEYSSQVQVQDLTHAGGHHSPDSGLTVSSDGVSSSDSPQHISASAAHALHHHNNHHHHHHHPTAHHNNPGPTVTRPTPVRSPFEWMKPTKPSYQSQPNPEAVSIHPSERFYTSKTRTKDKYRVVYSDHQRLELEKEFHYSRYITIRRKAELAQMLGLSERQVKIWFQNRRAKERKQGKKREESKNKDGSVMMQPGQLHAPPGVLLPTKIINLE